MFGVALKPEPVDVIPATFAPTAAPTLMADYAYERIKQASPDVLLELNILTLTTTFVSVSNFHGQSSNKGPTFVLLMTLCSL